MSQQLRSAVIGVRRVPLSPALAAGALLVLLLLLDRSLDSTVFTWGQLGTLGNESAVVGIAAVGETIVVLCGGFDLSVGAVISVANVVAATSAGSAVASTTGVNQTGSSGADAKMIVIVLAVGTAIGLSNGLLVTLLRIPSIVATLASSFFWGGVALLILAQPGGFVSPRVTNWFTGTAFGPVPSVFVVFAFVIAVWLVIKHTRFGTAIYAVGGNPESAAAAGVRVPAVRIGAYSAAGFFYGLSGVFLTAQSGSGDPNIGAPVLLGVFAAVVIGGTQFGAGRGGAVGTLIGAVILTLIGNILYTLGVSSFYTDIFNGTILVVAILLMSFTEGGLGAEWADAIRRHRSRVSGHARIAGSV